MTTAPVRMGIVGLGAHGKRYARHILEDVPGLVLAGFHRRDASLREALAAELGVPAFSSLPELLAACDALAVVTPPPSHLEICRQALDAGKPVLVEKPLTVTAAEAEELEEAERRTRGRITVAHTLRYDAVVREARARLPEIGRVRYFRLSQRLPPAPLAWQKSLAASGGGSILLTGVHLFDTAAWVLGEPLVLERCVAERHRNAETEDFFHATGRTPSGVHVSLEVSKFTTFRSCLLEAVGDEGQLFGDYQRHGLEIGRGNERTRHTMVGVPTVREMLADFARFVRGERANPIPLREGLAAVALADEAYRLSGFHR